MTKTTYFTGQKRQHTFADDNWYLVRIAMIILELVGNTLLVCVITSLVDPYITNGYKHMTQGLFGKSFTFIQTTDYKPVYKGQPRGITKVAFVDRWPLFGASETTYPIFTGQIQSGLYSRKPLLAGVVMHRFDCRYAQV